MRQLVVSKIGKILALMVLHILLREEKMQDYYQIMIHVMKGKQGAITQRAPSTKVTFEVEYH